MNLVLNDHQILLSLVNELNKVGIRCRVICIKVKDSILRAQLGCKKDSVGRL